MEKKMHVNNNKDGPESNERKALIFKYVSLAIQKKREGETNGELEKIRKELGLSHQEIIDAASKMSVTK